MTYPFDVSMVKKPKTPQQLEAARARAAHAREVRIENAKKRRESKMPETENAVAPKQGRGRPKKVEPTKAEMKKIKAQAKNMHIDMVIDFIGQEEAYEAKIASLEHQAIQYRTVIDYLESKVDSLLSRK